MVTAGTTHPDTVTLPVIVTQNYIFFTISGYVITHHTEQVPIPWE